MLLTPRCHSALFLALPDALRINVLRFWYGVSRILMGCSFFCQTLSSSSICIPFQRMDSISNPTGPTGLMSSSQLSACSLVEGCGCSSGHASDCSPLVELWSRYQLGHFPFLFCLVAYVFRMALNLVPAFSFLQVVLLIWSTRLANICETGSKSFLLPVMVEKNWFAL